MITQDAIARELYGQPYAELEPMLQEAVLYELEGRLNRYEQPNRCTTPLCGQQAAWWTDDSPPRRCYKCQTCYRRNSRLYPESQTWTLLPDAPEPTGATTNRLLK